MEVIRISSKVRAGVYINDVKSKLENLDSVQLQALQGGISIAVRTADLLISAGYTVLTKFETSIYDDKSKTGSFEGAPMVTLTLTKAAGFEKVKSDYEKKLNERKTR